MRYRQNTKGDILYGPPVKYNSNGRSYNSMTSLILSIAIKITKTVQ